MRQVLWVLLVIGLAAWTVWLLLGWSQRGSFELPKKRQSLDWWVWRTG